MQQATQSAERTADPIDAGWIELWRGELDESGDAREQILFATLEVIAERGIEGLTTKRVSKKLSMSTGIIHHHFQTKDNLVYETFVFFVERLHRRVLVFLRANPSPSARLQVFVDSQFGEDMLSRAAANLWVHFWYRSLGDERVSRLLRLYSKRFISNVAFALRDYVDDPAAAPELALEFFSLIHGLWIEYAITGVIDDPEVARGILRRYLQRLRSPG